MARGIENQRTSMELNGLIEVGQRAPLLKSVCQSDGKVVERPGPSRMTRGTERQRSSMELDCLI
jgi:hypothetical protein